jgi:hypothetical protein
VGRGQTVTAPNFGYYTVIAQPIVDNNNSGFTAAGTGWTTVVGSGYQGSYVSHAPGGSSQAIAGPDGFGYSAVSTPFQNLELVGDPNAFPIISAADDASVPVDLGSHVFTFYGQQFTGNNQLYVSSNGLITFGSANSTPFPGDLSTSPFQYTIAPLGADWITGPGTPMILGKFDNTNHVLIIEWNKIRHFPGTQGVGLTFQAILQLDNTGNASDIVFNYVNLTGAPGYDEGNSTTVGIKASGFQGTQRVLVSSAGVNVATHHAIRITTNPVVSGVGTATWTVTPAGRGTYELFATWVALANNATNATYKVYDGTAATGTLLGSVVVDQTQSPSTALINGSLWDKLGTFSTTTGFFTIVLDSSTANGTIIADAVFVTAGGNTNGPLLRSASTGSAGGNIDPLGQGALGSNSQPSQGSSQSPAPAGAADVNTVGVSPGITDQLFLGSDLQLAPSFLPGSEVRRALPGSGLVGDPLTGQLLDELASDLPGVE